MGPLDPVADDSPAPLRTAFTDSALPAPAAPRSSDDEHLRPLKAPRGCAFPLRSAQYGDCAISRDELPKVSALRLLWEPEHARLCVEHTDLPARQVRALVVPFLCCRAVESDKYGLVSLALSSPHLLLLLRHPLRAPSACAAEPLAHPPAPRLALHFRDAASAAAALRGLGAHPVFRAALESSPLRDYRLEARPLGQGTFGQVYRGVDAAGRAVAVKVISKRPRGVRESAAQRAAREAAIRREFATQAGLRHPNVIEMLGLSEDEEYMYLVQELAEGGEVFDRVRELAEATPEGQQPAALCEETARHIVRQLLETLAYLHARSVVHRDLKTENIIFASAQDTRALLPTVKLVDFGISKLVTPEDPAQTITGTPGYLAPEVMRGQPYTDACDVWSCGIVLHFLLTAAVPFHRQGDTALTDDMLRRFSPDCAAFLRRVLQADPAARPTARQALEDPFFSSNI